MLSVFKYVCDFAVSDSSVILPPHVGFECDNVVSSGRPRSRVKACLALETGQTLPSVGQPQHYTPRCPPPPLTFSCSCLTSSFGSRSHESCRHRTQCPLLSLLRDTSRLLWQGFVSHGRKGPKDNNGHSVT